MTNPSIPSLKQFLSLPKEDVARVAPPSMIYSVSGTRRSAALAGKATPSDEYVRWSREQMLRCLDLIFDHGVQHIIMPVITPSQFNEATPTYREHLWRWLDEGLAGSDVMGDYQSRGWCVRIPFSEELERLHNAAQRLERETAPPGKRNLWVFVVPQHNQLWEWALARLLQASQASSSVSSTAEAVRYLYDADIPPATLYLDFGKPIVSPDLMPPLLGSVMHCYWTQRPGYSLDETQFRTILYDHAYLRATWREDKRGRAQQALEQRDLWSQDLIIGLGTRVGPFWYPAPTPAPPEE